MKLITKQLLSLLMILPFISPALVQAESGVSEPATCVYSAYYSPVEGQIAYAEGSFEAERRMNGNGISGASGEAVFMGMLAAPPEIPFGTRIQTPFGVGRVADRGGAIQFYEEGGVDVLRVDIYMGSGDEGLARALNFGMRKAPCTLYYDTSVVVDLDYNSISTALPSWVPQNSQPSTEYEPDSDSGSDNLVELTTSPYNYLLHLPVGLGSDSDGESVRTLKKALFDVGLYDGEVNTLYDQPLIEVIYTLQLEAGIVSGPTDYAAGFFGPKTREALYQHVVNGNDPVESAPEVEMVSAETVEISVPEIPSLDQLEFDSESTVQSSLQFITDESSNTNFVQYELFDRYLKYEDSGQDVKDLQRILIQKGFLLEGLDSGYFGQFTRDSVITLQLQWGIIQSVDQAGAGLVGPRTQLLLESFLND